MYRLQSRLQHSSRAHIAHAKPQAAKHDHLIARPRPSRPPPSSPSEPPDPFGEPTRTTAASVAPASHQHCPTTPTGWRQQYRPARDGCSGGSRSSSSRCGSFGLWLPTPTAPTIASTSPSPASPERRFTPTPPATTTTTTSHECQWQCHMSWGGRLATRRTSRWCSHPAAGLDRKSRTGLAAARITCRLHANASLSSPSTTTNTTTAAATTRQCLMSLKFHHQLDSVLLFGLFLEFALKQRAHNANTQ